MEETDQKLLEAIAFFERMLQTMPLDRSSLEFLSVAYEQTGQEEKRRDCLVRLADCLLNERDFDNAQVIAARLSVFREDPAARAAVERVEAAIQGQAPAATPAPAGWDRTFAPARDGTTAAFQDAGIEIHAL